MARKLKDVKVGKGSVKIGATGTVSALMMLELDSISCKRKPTVPVSVSCGASTKRRHPRRSSSDFASTSGSSTSYTNQRKPDNNGHAASAIPILGAEDIYIDRSTPNRCKPKKKGSQIVEIVDLKCGSPDSAWSRGPISSQFMKKLSFSRLSD